MRSRTRRAFSGVFVGSLVLAPMLCLCGTGTASAAEEANGVLVYSPPAGSSFNDEGGEATGTAYAKVLSLKASEQAKGRLVSTFDDARLIRDSGDTGDPVLETRACLEDSTLACHQEWPIFISDDQGGTWRKVSHINPVATFPGASLGDPNRLSRTAQPFLFELDRPVADLPKGTLLLSGQIRSESRNDPAAVSKLVIYKSFDQGLTWAYHATIDTGGPAVYDPSSSSTTTTVWEPSLAIDRYGGLVAYFSDERQKANGVLQAVSLRRSTDGGRTWGPIQNVAAPSDRHHRPGMITVARMGDGRFVATYEVVNARGYAYSNASPVYFKISEDGLNWGDPEDLGTPVELADGRGIGSSPFVKWVPSGGPDGMVVVASKWGLDSRGNLDQGQNFFVNYNLGEGPWERLPFAVTFDGKTSITGFAQGLDYSPDGKTLFQATNVENYKQFSGVTEPYNDIRVGSIHLDAVAYEAENAASHNVRLVAHGDASNGAKIGDINYADSYVEFKIRAPQAGEHELGIRYDNGSGHVSRHRVTTDSGVSASVVYSPTVDWGRFAWAKIMIPLRAGDNTVRFAYESGYAEIDQLLVRPATGASDPEFRIINRSSGKLLEVKSASTANGAAVAQWGPTGHATQVWRVVSNGATITLTNKNSGKLLEIPNAVMTDGAKAVQWDPTGHPTQEWRSEITQEGYRKLYNANSGKLLEIGSCSSADGADAQQWGPTGAPCQEWRFLKEGIQ